MFANCGYTEVFTIYRSGYHNDDGDENRDGIPDKYDLNRNGVLDSKEGYSPHRTSYGETSYGPSGSQSYQAVPKSYGAQPSYGTDAGYGVAQKSRGAGYGHYTYNSGDENNDGIPDHEDIDRNGKRDSEERRYGKQQPSYSASKPAPAHASYGQQPRGYGAKTQVAVGYGYGAEKKGYGQGKDAGRRGQSGYGQRPDAGYGATSYGSNEKYGKQERGSRYAENTRSKSAQSGYGQEQERSYAPRKQVHRQGGYGAQSSYGYDTKGGNTEIKTPERKVRVIKVKAYGYKKAYYYEKNKAEKIL